jgi:thiamine-phosphate pyrophosphorylase
MVEVSKFRRGLYAITPDEPDTGKLLSRVKAAILGGAVMLQYRNKFADNILKRAQARVLAEYCRAHGVTFIVNDDVDLALEVMADGAHLGSDDGDLAVARRALGSSRLLGASCYNRMDLADRACAAGADYIAFGSFYSSTTKPLAVRATRDLVTEAKSCHGLPVAVIGGITQDNAPPLIAAGADALCAISAVFDAPDIESAARGFAACFDQPAALMHGPRK